MCQEILPFFSRVFFSSRMKRFLSVACQSSKKPQTCLESLCSAIENLNPQDFDKLLLKIEEIKNERLSCITQSKPLFHIFVFFFLLIFLDFPPELWMQVLRFTPQKSIWMYGCISKPFKIASDKLIFEYREDLPKSQTSPKNLLNEHNYKPHNRKPRL